MSAIAFLLTHIAVSAGAFWLLRYNGYAALAWVAMACAAILAFEKMHGRRGRLR